MKAKKWCALGIISTLFSIIITIGIIFEFNMKDMKSYFSTGNDSIVLTPTLNNYNISGEVITSLNNDGQIEFELESQYIQNISISITRENTDNLPIEIFFRDSDDKPFKSIRQDYQSQNVDAVFKLNSHVSTLRIDVTNEPNESFLLNDILIDNSVSKVGLNKEFITQVIVVSIIIFFILCHFIIGINTLYSFLFRYRWYVAGGIILFCVLFELSGSSISLWGNYFDVDKNGLLFGVPRMIRTDEWATSTTMALSQEYTDYSYFSSVIRGGGTDSFIVYGQPVLHIAEVFRPFHWGYLILGSSKGLSFFWSARFVLLFLISFEFFRDITKDNQQYSFVGAVLMCFSPLIQWWFAINGLVEMIIAFELSIIMLNKYIGDRRWLHRCFYLIIICISAGMYLFTFYPAWMIPVAYILLIFIIYTLIDRHKEIKISKHDIYAMVSIVLVFLFIVAFVFVQSKDTILSVLNTDYPGSRFETGGGIGNLILNSTTSLFFPYSDKGLTTNVVELSMMFDLFPLGIILSTFVLIKEKKKDLLLILLIGVQMFFLVYMLVGVPDFVARISLMYLVPSGRTMVAFGIINIIMLIRVVSCHKQNINLVVAIIGSICYSFIVAMICKISFWHYLTKENFVVIILISLILSFSILYRRYLKRFFIFSITIILVITGLSVNPLQQSIDVIKKSDMSIALNEINDNDGAKWIFAGEDYPVINYPIMSGVPLLNSTNVYPNLEIWKEIDPSEEYKNIYNRYAHIRVDIVDNPLLNKFVLNYPDVFTFNATVDDLLKLGVEYVITKKDLTSFVKDGLRFKNVAMVDNFTIYKLS